MGDSATEEEGRKSEMLDELKRLYERMNERIPPSSDLYEIARWEECTKKARELFVNTIVQRFPQLVAEIEDAQDCLFQMQNAAMDLQQQLQAARTLLRKAAKEFRECEADTLGTPSEKHFKKLAEQIEQALKEKLNADQH